MMRIEPSKEIERSLIGCMIAATATIGSIIPIAYVIPFFAISIVVVIVGCLFNKLHLPHPRLKFVIENTMVLYNIVFFSILIVGLVNITLILIGEIL